MKKLRFISCVRQSRHGADLVGSLSIALTVALPAFAQTNTGLPAFSITPGFSVSQILTDNRDLRSQDPQGDLITQISPNLRISSRSGRIQGSLDYSINAFVYARESSRNQAQNALRAAFVAEAIERHLYVDMSASASQQSISAFGVQPTIPSAPNGNRTEFRTIQIGPTFRSNLSDVAELSAKLGYTKTSGTSSSAADSTSGSGSLSVSGKSGVFGWSLSTGKSSTAYTGGRSTSLDSAGLSLTMAPNPELRFSLRAGRESSNALSSNQQASTTWGFGAEWIPSPRTQFTAQFDRRYFGNGHSVSFQHRMSRSLIRFSDSRDESSGNGRGAPAVETVKAYDQLFVQLASQIPDPEQRDLLIRTLLASQGGFISNALTLKRQQDASYSLQGQRLNFAVTVFASDTRRLDKTSPAVDDFSLVERIQQHGYSFNSGYQLTPTTTATLGYSESVTASNGTQRGTGQRNLTAAITTQIAFKTSLSVTLRHVVFTSAFLPYSESAATAMLSYRF